MPPSQAAASVLELLREVPAATPPPRAGGGGGAGGGAESEEEEWMRIMTEGDAGAGEKPIWEVGELDCY